MAKQLWIKLWPDLLLSSPRYRRATQYQQWVWHQVQLRINDDGELRTDGLVWDIKILAEELGIDKRSTPRLESAVDRLVKLDLLSRKDDGTICLSRHKRLQKNTRRK